MSEDKVVIGSDGKPFAYNERAGIAFSKLVDSSLGTVAERGRSGLATTALLLGELSSMATGATTTGVAAAALVAAAPAAAQQKQMTPEEQMKLEEQRAEMRLRIERKRAEQQLELQRRRAEQQLEIQTKQADAAQDRAHTAALKQAEAAYLQQFLATDQLVDRYLKTEGVQSNPTRRDSMGENSQGNPQETGRTGKGAALGDILLGGGIAGKTGEKIAGRHQDGIKRRDIRIANEITQINNGIINATKNANNGYDASLKNLDRIITTVSLRGQLNSDELAQARSNAIEAYKASHDGKAPKEKLDLPAPVWKDPTKKELKKRSALELPEGVAGQVAQVQMAMADVKWDGKSVNYTGQAADAVEKIQSEAQKEQNKRNNSFGGRGGRGGGGGIAG
jgi:hypothetical protein